MALVLAAVSANAQVASIDEDERSVLASVIGQTRLQGNEKWVMVEDEVATFQCSATAMINVGGCGGMRRKTQPEEEVMEWLREQFPAASPELLADFRTKVQFPATIRRPLPLDVKQVLWGRIDEKKRGVVAGGPLPKGNPDYLFSVSRVAFDPPHREALAYVAGVSWTDPERQYGEYVYLRSAEGQWSIAARARVWRLSAARGEPKK